MRAAGDRPTAAWIDVAETRAHSRLVLRIAFDLDAVSAACCVLCTKHNFLF